MVQLKYPAHALGAPCALARRGRMLLVGWLLVGWSAGIGAEGVGTVRGTVHDERGRPVPAARVFISPITGGGSLDTTTDVSGRFMQHDVTPGLYAVAARTDTLDGGLFRIRVRAGRVVEVNFRLVAGQQGSTWLAELGQDEAVSRAFAAGLAASRAEDFAAAINHYSRAIAVRPGCAECHFNLAVAYSEIGRLAEAADAFTRVLEVAPEYAAAYYGLAGVYTRQGRSAEAAQARAQATRIALDGLEQRREEAQAALERGRAQLDAGDLRAARRSFEMVLERDSSFADAHYWLGVSLLRSNAREHAAAEFKRYLELQRDGIYAEQAQAHLSQLTP